MSCDDRHDADTSSYLTNQLPRVASEYANEPREWSGPSQRRASERVGESEGAAARIRLVLFQDVAVLRLRDHRVGIGSEQQTVLHERVGGRGDGLHVSLV
jgi:hypothetical protein